MIRMYVSPTRNHFFFDFILASVEIDNNRERIAAYEEAIDETSSAENSVRAAGQSQGLYLY